MAEPDDLVLTILRELRREMKDGFEAVDRRFETVDGRFTDVNKRLDGIREALKSETILGRYVVNGVDDRLDAIEEKISRLDDLERRVTSLERQS
jgi:chaperonin cofactor prefoldin